MNMLCCVFAFRRLPRYMADQDTQTVQSGSSVSASEIDVLNGISTFSVNCTKACDSEPTAIPLKCTQTSASLDIVSESFNPDVPNESSDMGLVQSSTSHLTEHHNSTEADTQLKECPAVETLTRPCLHIDQETSSAVSPLPLSSHTDFDNAKVDISDSFPVQTSDHDIDSEHLDLLPAKATDAEEVTLHAVETKDFSSPMSVGRLLTPKTESTNSACTPESQSVKYPVVQSSVHSTRQVKCRKTGHRRITANGANLSLGQLINAVSESCLTESLDSKYHANSAGFSGAAEHGMTTPVKADDTLDCSAIKDNLSRHFDADSKSGLTTQGSPQVVDGGRRPPKARKSCPSNDNKAAADCRSDLPNLPGSSSYGTVSLAGLVDAQSLDQLDVRTFDEMLLAKMRERMKPTNGYRFLPPGTEQTQAHTAVMSSTSDSRVQSGKPLIPATTKAISIDHDSGRPVCGSRSTRTTTLAAQSGQKRIWRCRKSSTSQNSNIGKSVTQSAVSSDEMTETQVTRRSPRCSRRSPSSPHLDAVNAQLIC